MLIACPHCLATNRVPEARTGDAPVCGRCGQALLPAHPVALTDATFEPVLARTELPVVVDFWAPWCGPCRAMAPAFEQVARELQGQALFAKVNSDECPQASTRHGIRSIPTLIAFRGGREVKRISGALPGPQIAQFVRSA